MRRERLIYLALGLITAIVFWPVSRCEFVNYDDPWYITDNPHIRQGLSAENAAWAFQSIVSGNWHPVTVLSHMLDCQCFGLNPGAHHLVNLLFHIANTLLLFHVLRRTTQAFWPSAMVAALFAVHPLHVESVAWISERKDVLSTFFGLLSLATYARYVEAVKSRTSKGAALFALSLLLFAFGLMSKPMLVTWPCILLLLDFWPLRRIVLTSLATQLPTMRRLFLEKLPFFALTIISCAATLVAQRSADAVISVGNYPISERLGSVLIAYVRYLGKAFWPSHLTIFYPYPHYPHPDWPPALVVGSAVLLALITALTTWQARRRPYLIFGWLWFLGTLVPVIGLVQVGMQSLADRYTYIPLIGVFVMVVWGAKDVASRWPKVRTALGAVAVVTLIACLVLTSLQLRHWRTSESLWRRAIAVTRDNTLAQVNLGKALIEAGKADDGLAHLDEALRLKPDYVEVQVKAAETLLRQGKIRESVSRYREALRYQPDAPDLLNNLAWLLATSSDDSVRDGGEAVQLAERACDFTHYQKTIFIGTLAAAYAEAGRFEDAIRTAGQARAVALAAGEAKLAERNQELLELYRAGQPYRERPGS